MGHNISSPLIHRNERAVPSSPEPQKTCKGNSSRRTDLDCDLAWSRPLSGKFTLRQPACSYKDTVLCVEKKKTLLVVATIFFFVFCTYINKA